VTANLKAVVEALATRIRTGLSAVTLGGRVYAFSPDTSEPPFIVVLPSPADFLDWDRTFDGSDDYSLTVKIVMGSADDRSNQAELLDALARTGATSIYAAIKADTTLGGTVAMTSTIRGTAYGDVEWNSLVYFGAELLVECGT
jgi:hypothetical protein